MSCVRPGVLLTDYNFFAFGDPQGWVTVRRIGVMSGRVSRRRFLEMSGLAAAGSGLQGRGFALDAVGQRPLVEVGYQRRTWPRWRTRRAF
jgi:hypothetical protein